MTTDSQSESRMVLVTEAQRHALVLRAWEAINAERELKGVLAAVSEVLVPLVPFGGVALTALEGCGAYAFHIVGSAGESRSAEEAWRAYAVNPAPMRPTIPYQGSDLWRKHQAGLPYACADLLEKETWLLHESKLAAMGVRSYAACPLRVRGKPMGAAVFCRGETLAFTDEELTVLTEVSRALASGSGERAGQRGDLQVEGRVGGGKSLSALAARPGSMA